MTYIIKWDIRLLKSTLPWNKTEKQDKICIFNKVLRTIEYKPKQEKKTSPKESGKLNVKNNDTKKF